VRTSAIACLLGALGALGGAWLVGRWAFGLTLTGLSMGLIVWGLLRDDGTAPRAEQLTPPTLREVLEKARRAS
jgi:hypothetical protein